MKRHIEVVCHKGANKQAPENTFAAARLCLEWGVDTVEFDVHTSSDGVFFIFHGPYLQRTTNGTGWIGAYSAEELDKLDAGSWFSPAFAGEHIPRLEEYLRWIKGKAKIFVDVKNADPARLAELIRATGFENDCFFWSSDPNWMAQMHALAPELALKVNVSTVEGAERAVQELGARLVEVDYDKLTGDLIDACHRLGLRVMALYLGNDPAVFRQILSSGVDLINTDYGDEFLRVAHAEG